MIALPPFEVGAVQLSVACPLPAEAETFVGALGGPIGVTAFEGVDAGPVPAPFVAVTVKVYEVPFMSPVTVAVVVVPLAVVAVTPPGAEVTV